LQTLKGNPDWDGEELARQIVESYRNYYSNRPRQWPWRNVNQCAVKIDSLRAFSTTFNRFVIELKAGLSDQQKKNIIINANNASTISASDQIDLQTLCVLLTKGLPDSRLKSEATAVIGALKKCRLDQWVAGNYAQASGGLGGLSIYFPRAGAKPLSKLYKR